MITESAASPFSFLSALDGAIPLHRNVISETRESELDVAIHMVAAAKVSLLYAYSGNGKSSFINAGLIPFFVNRGYAVFRTRPRPPMQTEDPSQAFKSCVLGDAFLPRLPSEDFTRLLDLRDKLQLQQAAYAGDFAALLDRLELFVNPAVPEAAYRERIRTNLVDQMHLGLHDFVSQLQRSLGTSVPILFVCDQFEELFVHFSNTTQMESYIGEIGKICRDESLHCQFVFSMREDWVGSMIEFRREVPDIFGGYFKLAPLKRSSASAAVTLPLAQTGVQASPDLIAQVLDDLCALYSSQELSEFSAVKLMRSDTSDPYLELPALQVLMDTMWRTRTEVAEPFTLGHYRWLGSRSQHESANGNLAERVLSDYLGDFLNLELPSSLPEQEAREARLDILFLLTDRRAHRRALTTTMIVEKLAGLRPKGLELPTLDRNHVIQLLEPLVRHKLVRQDTAVGGVLQFELAHDFAVREVVRRWKILDDQRSNEITFREKIEKEISKRRLAVLFRQEALTRVLLLVCTGFLFYACLQPFIGFLSVVGGPSLTIYTLAAAVGVTVLGLAARLPGVAVLGIITLLELPWWFSDVDYAALLASFRSEGIDALNEGLPAHILIRTLPLSFAIASVLLVTGLLVRSRRRAKTFLYSLAVEIFETATVVGIVAAAFSAILYTPLVSVTIVAPGALWWTTLLGGSAIVHWAANLWLVTKYQRTLGSWLAGFKWNGAAAGRPLRLLWRTLTVLGLAVATSVTVVGGILLSLLGTFGSGSRVLAERVGGLELTPDETTTALERPAASQS